MFDLPLEIPKKLLPGRHHPDPGRLVQEHPNKHSRMFDPCRSHRGLRCSLNQRSMRHKVSQEQLSSR